MGDIVSTGWKLDTSGPVPGYITCPTASACYVTGDGTVTPKGPADYDSLYVSNDGGASWSVRALPDNFTFSAPLSCSGAETCAGGGVINGRSVFITTSDGGDQWTVTPLSTPGELVWLVCASPSTCSGIAAPASVLAEIDTGSPSSSPSSESFVRTNDGGSTWSAATLSSGDLVASLACPTAVDCVAVGYPVSSEFNREGVFSGFVLSTSDGGTTWTSGVLPPAFGFGYGSAVSCGDATHCMALGLISVKNIDECVGSGPASPGSGGCSSGAMTEVSGVITTADGGATWQLEPLPADVPLPGLSTVSCSSSEQCWVAGTEAVPQGSPNNENGGSAVVLGTADGGVSWSKTTFTVPAGALLHDKGDSYESVGEISCPSDNACLGLGISVQGSTSTPVYSTVANVPSA